MKLSRKWLQEEFIDLSHISDQEFIDRMTAFGHHVNMTKTYEDTLFEFEIPDHRPDCRSIIGLVREISAAFQIPFQLQESEVIGSEQYRIYELLDAEIWAEELCNRFSCRIAMNVTICPSPEWMQKRLTACGIPPVNNIIDSANYTALEYGQKIVVLDLAAITSGSIWIRDPMPGEDTPNHIPVLSDSMMPLTYGDNVICPEAKVSQNTTSIVIIAANYDVSSDPMLTVPALQRFCQLMKQHQWGQIADGVIDLLNYVPQPKVLPFDMNTIIQQLDTTHSTEEIIQHLNCLGIRATPQEIQIPSHRADLNNFEDILKELRRITSIHLK